MLLDKMNDAEKNEYIDCLKIDATDLRRENMKLKYDVKAISVIATIQAALLLVLVWRFVL